MKPPTLISLTLMVLTATSPLTSLEWQQFWGTSQALAQTAEDRQAEADRLLDLCDQQWKTS